VIRMAFGSVHKTKDPNLYLHVLRIPTNASNDQILDAYLNRCEELEEDEEDICNEPSIQILAVTIAYEVLSSPKKKALYDEWGVVEYSLEDATAEADGKRSELDEWNDSLYEKIDEVGCLDHRAAVMERQHIQNEGLYSRHSDSGSVSSKQVLSGFFSKHGSYQLEDEEWNTQIREEQRKLQQHEDEKNKKKRQQEIKYERQKAEQKKGEG